MKPPEKSIIFAYLIVEQNTQTMNEHKINQS